MVSGRGFWSVVPAVFAVVVGYSLLSQNQCAYIFETIGVRQTIPVRTTAKISQKKLDVEPVKENHPWYIPRVSPMGKPIVFTVLPTPSDGNCFYHAFVSVKSSGMDGKAFKNYVGASLKQYREPGNVPHFALLQEGAKMQLQLDWTEMMERMADNAENRPALWAQEAEVFYISALEKVNICVFKTIEETKNGAWQCSFDAALFKGKYKRTNTVYILNHKLHFQGLKASQSSGMSDRMQRRATMAGGKEGMRTC